MFGKEQPDVVTDDDVGNFVKQLHQEGVKEIETFILGEDDGINRDGLRRNRDESRSTTESE